MAKLPLDVVWQVVRRHGGEGNDYVGFSDLRSDAMLRTFFQRTIGRPAFSNKEFQVWFDEHSETFEIERKKARVRLRTAEQQLRNTLQRADTQRDVVKALVAAGDELGKLTMDIVVPTLLNLSRHLTQQRSMDEEAHRSEKELVVARERLLAVFPASPGIGGADAAVFGDSSQACEDLSVLLTLRTLLDAFDVCLLADSSQHRENATAFLSACIAARLKAEPSELEWEVLWRIFALPLEWKLTSRALVESLPTLLGSPWPVGAARRAIASAAALGMHLTPVVELLGSAELTTLPRHSGEKALETLNFVVTVAAPGSALLFEVVAQLAPPLLERVPPNDLFDLVIITNQKGVAVDSLSLPLKSLSPHFLTMSIERVLTVMVTGDGAIAGVPDLRSVAEAAANVLIARFSELNLPRLLVFTQGVLYLGSTGTHTQKMLDFWARSLQAGSAAPKCPASTETEQSRLDGAADVNSLLDVIALKKMRLAEKKQNMAPDQWFEGWADMDHLISADQLAWLLRLLVAARSNHRVIEVVALRVAGIASELTMDGRQNVGTAVLSELSFPGKAPLTAALAKAQKAASEAAFAEAVERQKREQASNIYEPELARSRSPSRRAKQKRMRSAQRRKAAFEELIPQRQIVLQRGGVVGQQASLASR